jgi:outer membrane protein OmpA-like peptidoglycan-associated protein
MSGWKMSSASLALMLLTTPVGAQPQDECASVEARFDAALERHDFSATAAIESELKTGPLSALCWSRLTRFRVRRAALQIQDAEALKDRPDRQAERERLILQADEPQLLWTAAYLAGKVVYWPHEQYAKAADAFNRALTIVSDEAGTSARLSRDEWQELVDRAYAAKALAPAFVNARPTRGGTIPGYRGVVRVPLPIQFETDRAELTDKGKDCALELAEAIKQQRPAAVILEGHTDERGTDAHNDDLSRRRVKTVEAFLRTQGVTARIVTVAKGKHEPFDPPGGASLPQEKIWELNRRVVWRQDS